MADLASAATGAAVSGGLGIISSGLNYLFNKKLAAQQNQYNLDMWKMQADYNSPQAQMQRFSEAGLNPNLIYGQGSNGNMANAPQMVTPQVPEFSRAAQKLGEAFNIENLRTLIAKRKEAQANADNARTNATRNSRELFADEVLGRYYMYDLKSGKFLERPTPPEGQVDVIHPAAYYVNRRLASHYLQPYKGQLLRTQNAYLVPQVSMQQYEQRHYPTSYWIGQGQRVIKGISDLTGMFNPSRYVLPLRRGGQYMAPDGRIYDY